MTYVLLCNIDYCVSCIHYTADCSCAVAPVIVLTVYVSTFPPYAPRPTYHGRCWFAVLPTPSINDDIADVLWCWPNLHYHSIVFFSDVHSQPPWYSFFWYLYKFLFCFPSFLISKNFLSSLLSLSFLDSNTRTNAVVNLAETAKRTLTAQGELLLHSSSCCNVFEKVRVQQFVNIFKNLSCQWWNMREVTTVVSW